MLGINTAILSDLQVRAGVYRPAYMQWRRQRQCVQLAWHSLTIAVRRLLWSSTAWGIQVFEGCHVSP